MLHVLHGADEFRASEALAALKASLDADGMLATNTTTLPARGLTPHQLIQHAAAVPFLAAARLVIVEGLFSTLGSRRGVVEQWQPLLDFVPQLPESNHVVLLEPPAGRDGGVGRSSLLRALRAFPNVTVTEFPELKTYGGRGGAQSEVAAWLDARASERGIAIEPRATEALVGLIGPQLRLLASELEKVATYTGGRAITAEDVHLLTPQAREESVFNLVDAVVEGRGAAALRVLTQILEDGGQPPAYLQAMLARQVRHLVRATELLEGRADERAIGTATGVSNAFALGKLVRQARAITREAAEQSLREIERSDQLVKTGKLNEVLAIELLALRLSLIAERARAGAERRGR
ncbi:MAG: DNA polymerase III subunit delta [Chloroflexi bacterium]|nr:DNA polymerase III subunit delta [Chloroflexota bacterium]